MSSPFVWDGNPVMFTIPAIPLPVELSLIGLVLAFIAYNVLVSRKTKGKPLNPWLLGVGAFVAGQVIGLVLPGPTFDALGPIAPRWYGLMFALSFYLGYKIGARTFLDAKLPLQYADSLFLYLMAGTVLGA
ncbi:MAG: hypothetical protein RL177_1108, partial [Bacteroidota bacterium]